MSNPNTAAKPQDSMLFEPPFSPLTALFHKSTYRSLPLTIVTMNANIALILTVYLANIPFSNDKARVAWVASFYFSLAIFGLMTISIIALMILIRAPETPLAPDTIGSAALISVCGTHDRFSVRAIFNVEYWGQR